MIEHARVAERLEAVPRHVALVMDGIERWASEGRRSTLEADRAAAKALGETARAAARYGVELLTVHLRSESLLRTCAVREFEALRNANIRIQSIGPVAGWREASRKELERGVAATADRTGMTLNLAVNYGARAELCAAVRALAFDVAAGRLHADAIDEDVFAGYFYSPELPDPDLLIRTGGEPRLPNFLLYQCAYSELWSTTTLWPDFDGRNLSIALHAYASRQRRFGT